MPDDLTGCSVAEKLSNIRKEMEDAGATLLVLTKLDETAWVTNLRGTDIDYNPVFEGYLVIDRERATCFTRVSPPAEVTDSLASLIDFEPYAAYAEAMERYGAEASGMVWLDPSGTTMGTRLMLHEDQKLYEKPNPTVALKAIKNETEIAAARNSHRHAAAAKIRSFRRLQDSIPGGRDGQRGGLQPDSVRRVLQRGRLLRPQLHHHRRCRSQWGHRPLRRRQPRRSAPRR